LLVTHWRVDKRTAGSVDHEMRFGEAGVEKGVSDSCESPGDPREGATPPTPGDPAAPPPPAALPPLPLAPTLRLPLSLPRFGRARIFAAVTCDLTAASRSASFGLPPGCAAFHAASAAPPCALARSRAAHHAVVVPFALTVSPARCRQPVHRPLVERVPSERQRSE
jgi:hypothetical protein